MSKILVTGGAGYLGSVIVPELLRAGHEVTVIDSLMYGQTSLLDICHYPKFQMVRGDARNVKLLQKHLAGKDFIFPLACLTGAPLCAKDPDAAKTVNLGAIKLILKHRKASQRIIFPTTNSGYGIGQKGKACDEKTPLNPISLYGKLKVQAEKEILSAGNSLTFRLATVFGVSPRMRLDLLVNDFVYRAVNDRFIILFEADFMRNYVHVRDVSRAFQHGMKNFTKMIGQPYNVGLSTCNISKRGLAEEIAKEIPEFRILVSEIGKDPDQRDYIVSNAKIEKTGFKTKFSLQFGIKELIKGYQVIKRNQFANY